MFLGAGRIPGLYSSSNCDIIYNGIKKRLNPCTIYNVHNIAMLFKLED